MYFRLRWSFLRYDDVQSPTYQLPYSLIQTFAGKFPFHDVSAPAVPAGIMDGKRPKRPDHPNLTDTLWELAERCWAETAQDRPEMKEVIETLEGMSVYVKNLSLTHPRRSVSEVIQTLPSQGSVVSWTTSSQRLYDLDKSFSRELDKLLHDEKYVGGLLHLPENELIQLVNYLNDVGFPPVKLI